MIVSYSEGTLFAVIVKEVVQFFIKLQAGFFHVQWNVYSSICLAIQNSL